MNSNKHYLSAQRAYDNRMPPEDDLPDPPESMECPECDTTVEFDEYKLTGTCPNCGCECEFDENDF